MYELYVTLVLNDVVLRESSSNSHPYFYLQKRPTDKDKITIRFMFLNPVAKVWFARHSA